MTVNQNRIYTENRVIKKAKSIIEGRMQNIAEECEVYDSYSVVKDYARIHLGNNKNEIFSCILLNNKLALIRYIEFFHGTINECTVYPREIVRACIDYNASHIIFIHNHPSGDPEPSIRDISLTKNLKMILEIIDVSVLDHIIVGSDDGVISMVEDGYTF